jgi:hypothetical protein
MPYAVLQTDLNSPTVEQLRRAARLVPGLTAMDGDILGRDAFGVLVKNFSEHQAGALQGALRLEGVETEIVDQSFLPALPEARLVRRLDCTADHLLIYDPLGNSFPLEWRHVMLLAAGAVTLTDFTRRQEERPRIRYTANGMPYRDTDYETVFGEERNPHLIAEILITGAALRYSFIADQFNFAGLADRKSQSVTANFSTLLADIVRFSAMAALNRGAESIRLQAPEIVIYPSKNAFYEEIVWMLWQMKKAA